MNETKQIIHHQFSDQSGTEFRVIENIHNSWKKDVKIVYSPVGEETYYLLASLSSPSAKQALAESLSFEAVVFQDRLTELDNDPVSSGKSEFFIGGSKKSGIHALLNIELIDQKHVLSLDRDGIISDPIITLNSLAQALDKIE